MKKLIYLIIIVLISGLILTGCLLSNVGQVPATEQSGITYLTKNPGSPDLVGLWHFDGDALDSSGYGNDGTIIGATYAGIANAMFGDALSFDGNDYVEVPDSSSLDITVNITVEGWIKLTSFAQQSTVAGKWKDIGGTSQRGYLLTVGTDGKPYFFVSANGINWPYAVGSALSLNTWYHLAGTWDGTTIKVYVGTTPASTGQTGTIFSNNQPLLIGANDGWGGSSRKFTNGIVDEVRVWSSVLGASQLDDMLLPVVTSPNNGATYLLNQEVYADWSAVDGTGIGPGNGVTGVDSVVGSIIKGSALATSTAGSHSFTVTATDYAKNSYTKTVTYNVVYGFLGLLPPYMAPPRAFKIGSSIPLKWQYTDSAGNVVDSAAANPSVGIKPVTGDGTPVEGIPIIVEDPGLSGYQYDSLTTTWQYNWQTKGLTAGLYYIRITSGQTGQVNGPFPIQLR